MKAFRRWQSAPAEIARRRTCRGARQCVQPVPDRPADGAAAAGSGQSRIGVEGELISKPYIGITLALMAALASRCSATTGSGFIVSARRATEAPATIHVEGDASSASYFLAAGAIGGGPVRVEGVGRSSMQGDVRFADALARWARSRAWARTGSRPVCAGHGRLQGHRTGLQPHSRCGDDPGGGWRCSPTARPRSRNIASWRVKETDRIAAMATELRKVGATVEEGADYHPHHAARTPHPSTPPIDTYDDHRMAMCFSLVALGGVPVRINDPACVNKTFPDYFQAFCVDCSNECRESRSSPSTAPPLRARARWPSGWRLARLSLSGQRRAVPADRAGGDEARRGTG